MSKRRYTREFKLKVVQAVESGELRPAQACREYQIGESVMNRWRQEVRLRGTDAAFTPPDTPTAVPDCEARIDELGVPGTDRIPRYIPQKWYDNPASG